MLDAAFAQIYIDSHTAPEAEPYFTSDQANAIFESAKAIDASGVSPGGEGYEDTYTYPSMHAAILGAWQIKLASAVELHEGDESKIFDHIKEMITYWSGRVSGVIVGGSTGVSQGSVSIETVAVW